ncbi:MAG: PD-(D/E)XK nuclease family transposase [Oscillospiraceae bacterium]|nr:PD-(D/E)XK nuclease family transposase [Oscillospiraceae bacterium]
MEYTEKTPEQYHAEDLERIKNFRPIDDDFMRELFRNDIPLVQNVLRIITGIEDLTIVKQVTQYDMHRLAGARSLCLDVFATDSSGRHFDLEIQRADSGATPRRARFHSSAMDVEYLGAGEEFANLPITYTIFITENDVRGKGEKIYTYSMRDDITSEALDDGRHIIFVNGAYNNENDKSALANLIHDFRCNNADDMLLNDLAERTRYFKENEEGVSTMCKAIEDMKKEVAYRTDLKARINFAISLINDGLYPLSKIASLTQLSEADVQELAHSLNSNS